MLSSSSNWLLCSIHYNPLTTLILICFVLGREAPGAALTKLQGQSHVPGPPRPFPSPLQKKVIGKAETLTSQFGSPTASRLNELNDQENEPGPRLRRDKRRRGEVLQHTVARPSRSTRMSGRTINTITTGDTRIRGKRYRKAGARQQHEQREPAAKDIFGEVSMYDPYTFE